MKGQEEMIGGTDTNGDGIADIDPSQVSVESDDDEDDGELETTRYCSKVSDKNHPHCISSKNKEGMKIHCEKIYNWMCFGNRFNLLVCFCHFCMISTPLTEGEK